MTIRIAEARDAEALCAIYAPYVTDTAITFEYEVPSVQEFTQRITDTLQKYPYLVAEQEGTIVGYAYASAFKGRRAYDWAVETSIYVARDRHGQGIGRSLYEVLEQILVRQHITNVNACIAYTQVEDRYLTNDSRHFHARLGYRMVGTFHRCAYKFDRWFDMIWMEKDIAGHTAHPQEVLPFPMLEREGDLGIWRNP